MDVPFNVDCNKFSQNPQLYDYIHTNSLPTAVLSVRPSHTCSRFHSVEAENGLFLMSEHFSPIPLLTDAHYAVLRYITLHYITDEQRICVD
jgi:hypothetical protein